MCDFCFFSSRKRRINNMPFLYSLRSSPARAPSINPLLRTNSSLPPFPLYSISTPSTTPPARGGPPPSPANPPPGPASPPVRRGPPVQNPVKTGIPPLITLTINPNPHISLNEQFFSPSCQRDGVFSVRLCTAGFYKKFTEAPAGRAFRRGKARIYLLPSSLVSGNRSP